MHFSHNLLCVFLAIAKGRKSLPPLADSIIFTTNKVLFVLNKDKPQVEALNYSAALYPSIY